MSWPVTAPPPIAAESASSGRLRRWIGIVLLLAAFGGAALWITTLSPWGFERVDVADTSGFVEIPRAGTVVVYEEYDGASGQPGPARVRATLTSVDGRRIAVSSVLDQDDRSPTTYRSPWHEGRAIGRAVVSDPGRYRLSAVPIDPGEAAVLPEPGEVTLAVGTEASQTWLGTYLGLVPLVAVPLIAGVALLLSARRP